MQRGKAGLGVFALMACVACGSTADTSGGDGGQGGTGGDGGQGGDGGVAPVACAVDLQWSDGATAAAGRDHHATFAASVGDKHFVYVTGGNDYGGMFDSVLRAELDEEGTMTAWQEQGDLPSVRAGHGVAMVGDRVYLAGGRSASQFYNGVIGADVGGDGSLGSWSELTPLPEGRFHLAMVEARGFLYVTGGLAWDTQAATDTVYRAKIESDGTLGAWQTSTLPRPRSHHASFAHAGYLYVAGGLEGEPAGFKVGLDDILRTPIADDGSLGAWERAGALPAIRMTHAAVKRGNCVYFVGGLVGSEQQADAVAVSLDDAGNVGAGVPMPSLMPNPVSHVHQVVLAGEHAVIIGGSTSLQNVTGESAIGRFVD